MTDNLPDLKEGILPEWSHRLKQKHYVQLSLHLPGAGPDYGDHGETLAHVPPDEHVEQYGSGVGYCQEDYVDLVLACVHLQPITVAVGFVFYSCRLHSQTRDPYSARRSSRARRRPAIPRWDSCSGSWAHT